MSEAKKFDEGKPIFTAMPTHAVEEMMHVMTMGCKKYGKFNYLQDGGLEPSRLIDAMYRHMTSWWHGETIDPESNRSHLAHVMCCAGMLLEYEHYKYTKDDRFKLTAQPEWGIFNKDLYTFKWNKKTNQIEVHFKKPKKDKKK